MIYRLTSSLSSLLFTPALLSPLSTSLLSPLLSLLSPRHSSLLPPPSSPLSPRSTSLLSLLHFLSPLSALRLPHHEMARNTFGPCSRRRVVGGRKRRRGEQVGGRGRTGDKRGTERGGESREGGRQGGSSGEVGYPTCRRSLTRFQSPAVVVSPARSGS